MFTHVLPEDNGEDLVIVPDDAESSDQSMKTDDIYVSNKDSEKTPQNDIESPAPVLLRVLHEEDDEETKFHRFVDNCVQGVKTIEYKELMLSKVPIIKKMFARAVKHTQTETFQKFLNKQVTLLQKNPKASIKCFNEVFQNLKFACTHYTEEVQEGKSSDANDEKIKSRIAKLDKSLRKLRAKIRVLENKEVGLDEMDDEDSSYIQLQRYRDRAVQVYNKMCTYTNENPHYDRITHTKLDFSKSHFAEFNRAINRHYKNNDVFPTYAQLNKLLTRCAEKKKLQIRTEDLATEGNVSYVEHSRLKDLSVESPFSTKLCPLLNVNFCILSHQINLGRPLQFLHMHHFSFKCLLASLYPSFSVDLPAISAQHRTFRITTSQFSYLNQNT